jgi:glycosyltransferase involved in cell wall biosynthesis
MQAYEIIIVDQSRDDLTLNVLSQLIQVGKVHYIKDDGSGAARARNIGWRKASGEIVAFTDDDALVEPKWLENIQYSFERKDLNIGVLGGRVIPFYEQRNPDWCIPKRWEHLLPAYDQGDLLGQYTEPNLPASVNYSENRSLLERFSGFDEILGSNVSRNIQIFGEDAELALRLKQNNFDIIYNPNCIVYHPVPLNRQNQDFLNKRLASEGATYAYLQIRESKNLLLHLASLVKSLVKYLYLTLSQANCDELHYLRGKIQVLFKCGLLNQHPDSL